MAPEAFQKQLHKDDRRFWRQKTAGVIQTRLSDGVLQGASSLPFPISRSEILSHLRAPSVTCVKQDPTFRWKGAVTRPNGANGRRAAPNWYWQGKVYHREMFSLFASTAILTGKF